MCLILAYPENQMMSNVVLSIFFCSTFQVLALHLLYIGMVNPGRRLVSKEICVTLAVLVESITLNHKHLQHKHLEKHSRV